MRPEASEPERRVAPIYMIRQAFQVAATHNAEVVGSSSTLATNRPTLTSVRAVWLHLRRSKERLQPNLLPIRQRVRILQLATLAVPQLAGILCSS
jgi:hypothetical protein